MKPTVINNSNSENTNQEQHPTDGANSGRGRYPQYSHGQRFGFDDPDEDVFANMGLRSRMNRMGNNPFDWSARKRRGSGQTGTNPYEQYFHDDVDFPHFGSTWDAFNRAGSKRHPHETNDRSGFFDYLPPEFRHYVPDNFGHRQRQRSPPPPAHQPPPQQHTHYQPTQSRSNLCDAAIQTDDLSSGENVSAPGNNERHPDNAGHQAQNNANNSNSASSTSSPYGKYSDTSTSTNGPGGYANASTNQPHGQYYPHAQQPHGQQYQGQHYQPYYSQPPQHHQQPQSQAHSQQWENNVRNVPIFIEGSTKPVNTRPAPASHEQPYAPQGNRQHPQPRPEPFASKEAFQQQTADDKQQQQQEPTEDSAQTPQTADCIARIQAIQRDVLNLMCAVEQFGGKRGDKEYMYLDEMLTRNLLKLDTIDTNGKDSIRLARREAIKCIQASIAVLENKADLHLNEKKATAEKEEGNSGAKKDDGAATEKSEQKDDKAEAEIKPTENDENKDKEKAEETKSEKSTDEAKETDKDEKKDETEKSPEKETGDKKKVKKGAKKKATDEKNDDENKDGTEKKNEGEKEETDAASELPKVQESVENITIEDSNSTKGDDSKSGDEAKDKDAEDKKSDNEGNKPTKPAKKKLFGKKAT